MLFLLHFNHTTMKKDYIPKTDAELRAWLLALNTNIVTQGPLLSMAATEITQLQEQASALIGAIDHASAKKNESQSAITAKDTQKQVSLKAIRDQVGVFKRKAGYSEAIGKLLGVIGQDVEMDLTQMKPELSASTSIAGVTLIFNKEQSEGINLYCQRGAETAFSFLARDTYSPYVDNRSKLLDAEIRKYYALYVMDDVEVGQPSNIITVSL